MNTQYLSRRFSLVFTELDKLGKKSRRRSIPSFHFQCRYSRIGSVPSTTSIISQLEPISIVITKSGLVQSRLEFPALTLSPLVPKKEPNWHQYNSVSYGVIVRLYVYILYAKPVICSVGCHACSCFGPSKWVFLLDAHWGPLPGRWSKWVRSTGSIPATAYWDRDLTLSWTHRTLSWWVRPATTSSLLTVRATTWT